MVPCGNLQYSVQSGSSFAGLAPTTSSGGTLNNNGTYAPGALGSDVVVQLAYNRQAVAPWTMVFLNGGGSSTVNTSNLLIATVAFQNEPP